VILDLLSLFETLMIDFVLKHRHSVAHRAASLRTHLWLPHVEGLPRLPRVYDLKRTALVAELFIVLNRHTQSITM
jgi:hypothetical protein